MKSQSRQSAGSMLRSAVIAVSTLGNLNLAPVQALKRYRQANADRPSYSIQSIDFRGRATQEIDVGSVLNQVLNETNSTGVTPVIAAISTTAAVVEPVTTVSFDEITFPLESDVFPEEGEVDVLIYGCSVSGLYTAMRLLDPGVTSDSLRPEVYGLQGGDNGTVPDLAGNGTNLTVVIVEPTNRCGGRLSTARGPESEDVTMDAAFLAELGDFAYFSETSSYVDVLIHYLDVAVEMLDVEVPASNLLYLRGRYLRNEDIASMAKDIYSLSYMEKDKTPSELLGWAIDAIVPDIYEWNSTEWDSVLQNQTTTMLDFHEVPLYEMGLWNVLSRVLSFEAIQLLVDYYVELEPLMYNRNALQGILSTVHESKLMWKRPLNGMEEIVNRLILRVRELGGLIVLETKMVDLIDANVLDGATNETSSLFVFPGPDESQVIPGGPEIPGGDDLGGPVPIPIPVPQFDFIPPGFGGNRFLQDLNVTDGTGLNETEVVVVDSNVTDTNITDPGVVPIDLNITTPEANVTEVNVTEIVVEPVANVTNVTEPVVPEVVEVIATPVLTGGDGLPIYEVLFESQTRNGTLNETGDANATVTAATVRTIVFANPSNADLDSVMENSPEYFTDDVMKLLDSMEPVHYARLYMCYRYPWWQSLGVVNGRSVSSSPLRSLWYFRHKSSVGNNEDPSMLMNRMNLADDPFLPSNVADYACLMSHTEGKSAEYWMGMQLPRNETEQMLLDDAMADPALRWDALNASEYMVDEAQRQLQIWHNLVYLPDPVYTLFVTSNDLTSTSHVYRMGVDVLNTTRALQRPNPDYNVFFVGERFSPPQYMPLEGDLQTAEMLLQEFFFAQPPVGTFDATGDITIEGRQRVGSAIAVSADGTRMAIVGTTVQNQQEVTVYQRLGDEFLGLWTEIGTNFVSNNIPLQFFNSIGENINGTLTNIERSGPEKRRALVEFETTANLTRVSVALSGDGETLAISMQDPIRGSYVQLFKDEGGGGGNWTKVGMDLKVVDDTITEANAAVEVQLVNNDTAVAAPLNDTQFGYALDLSFDGSILAVGAPNYAVDGAVFVYNCASGECIQRGRYMDGVSEVARYGASVSISHDGNVIAAGAPNVPEAFGYATVFAFVGFDWVQIGSTALSGGIPNDQFGFSVSVAADGSTLAVGAPGVNEGSAFVYSYDLDANAWNEIGLVVGTAEGDNLGFDVALSGDASRLLVGAPQIDNDQTGYVVALEYVQDDVWEPYGSELRGLEVGEQYGYSVALSFDGLSLAVGAPFVDGMVRTYAYVAPDIFTIVAMARMLWEENVGELYVWPQEMSCIPTPASVVAAGGNATVEELQAILVNGTIAVLDDQRLTMDIAEAILFEADNATSTGNSTGADGSCVNLLDMSEMFSNGPTDVIPQTILDVLDSSRSAFLIRVEDVPLPTSAPTAIGDREEVAETAAPTEAPLIVDNNVTFTAPPVAGNSTETGIPVVDNTTELVEPIVDNATAVEAPTAEDTSNAVAMKVIYNGEAWIGIGVSESGAMIGSTAVIGRPDVNSVRIYPLIAQDVGEILTQDLPPPTLRQWSITQDNGQTEMKFIKYMDETATNPDEIVITPVGNNQFIYAFGSSNTLAYHGPGNRGDFMLDLGKCENGERCLSDDPEYTSQEVIVGTPQEPVLTLYWKKLSLGR